MRIKSGGAPVPTLGRHERLDARIVERATGMALAVRLRRFDLPPLGRREARTRLGGAHVLAAQDGLHGGMDGCAEVRFRGRGGRAGARPSRKGGGGGGRAGARPSRGNVFAGVHPLRCRMCTPMRPLSPIP